MNVLEGESVADEQTTQLISSQRSQIPCSPFDLLILLLLTRTGTCRLGLFLERLRYIDGR